MICFLQKDYHNYGDSAPPITLALYFDELPDALEQRMEWTSSELEDALKLLSDRMWTLQNFLDTIVRSVTHLCLNHDPFRMDGISV